MQNSQTVCQGDQGISSATEPTKEIRAEEKKGMCIHQHIFIPKKEKKTEQTDWQ